MNLPTPTASSPRPALRVPGTQGYGVSSDELFEGLEVQTLSFTALPVELMTELLRMRKLWRGAELASAS